MGGQLSLMFPTVVMASYHVKSGRLVPLGISSAKRASVLPDVPTVAEAGVPGYSSVPWDTISVVRDVPPAIVKRLNADINAVLRLPEFAQRWDALGVLPLGGTPADAVRRNLAETVKWNAVITAAGLQAE